MSEPVDIHEPISELCRRLGHEPSDVAQIIFRPTECIVSTFALDEQGRKRVLADDVIVEHTTIKVTT